MAARSLTVLASFLAVASAFPCRLPIYTLPQTGTGTELPAVETGLKLLKIAVGHGIQNYTCASSSSATTATGALAVLYDITNLYPGTVPSGMSYNAFYDIPNQVLWGQDIPLNLLSDNANKPGTVDKPNAMSEIAYSAVVADPFLAPSPLSLPSVLAADAPFLGHHYFDASGVPTFDLSGAGLFGSMSKTGDVKAPSTAGAGILDTGAVDWLQLTASTNGLSKGIKQVYRVTTVGGVSASCGVIDAEAGSVPYTAFYWFFG